MANTADQEAPPKESHLAKWRREEREKAARLAALAASTAPSTPSIPPPPPQLPPPTDRLSSLPPDLFIRVTESLIARGSLASLASVNAASRSLYHSTLPYLWRTFIYDPRNKGKKEMERYWRRLVTSEGAKHIRQVPLFFVDRVTKVRNTTKRMPPCFTYLPAHARGELKAYIALFDDVKQYLVKSDEQKIVVHLLPAYEPLKGEDFTMLQNALVYYPRRGAPVTKAKKGKVVCKGNQDTSIGYAFFIIHSSDRQYPDPLPASINVYAAQRPISYLPVTLDAVLLAPATDAFTPADKPRLTRIVFDILASMDHEPASDCHNDDDDKDAAAADGDDHRRVVEWNGFVGTFTSSRIREEDRCRSYIEFHWQFGTETMIICAEAAAEALEPFRYWPMYNWVEFQFSNHTPFPTDDAAIHRILDILEVPYLSYAPRRLAPPDHGMGDVTVQDISRDLLAGLKRVVPIRAKNEAVEAKEEGGRGEDRNVVEYFIKRYPPGEGFKDKATFHDSHDRPVVFYKEYPM
ncbi:hypothetical protein QFC19_008342 [Naganishia cerealis]|uniref:Uncharacterized protein n=1 Tax=Naganishia cerealis TaxID=610337 RepID=A0ACC2V314_9TREE|nr:hypothetical protein QFC19_008342 [Naganishia cerealis]